MPSQNERNRTPTAHDLSNHTLSEPYFYGYTTSKSLVSDLDRVVVQPMASDRNEYIYYRNHHLRAWVDDRTKIVEVPGTLLGEQVCKVHRVLEANDHLSDVDVECRIDTSDLYGTTRSLMGDELRAFYEALQPEGDVIITRPEEFLSDVLSKVLGYEEDFVERFLKSSRKYLERVDDRRVTWSDVYESADGGHPKFEDTPQLVERIREQTDHQIVMAEALGGVLRGYKLTIDGQPFTLLCRGWGRDMSNLVTSELVDNYDVDSVVFDGGCGALQPGFSMNDFVTPTAVSAPGEERIEFDNTFLADEQFTAHAPHATGELYNVDSPADETVDYMSSLVRDDYVAVEMEVYGIARAMRDTDVPFGVLLFVMDLPMEGIDLGQTNYDVETKRKIVAGNQRMTLWTLVHYGLLDVADLRDDSRDADTASPGTGPSP